MAELTPKTIGLEVLARGDGTCKGPCIDEDGPAIRRGEHYIAKVERHGWMHGLCAKAYVQVLDEHVADDEDQALAEQATDEAKAERIRQICRELNVDLDVPRELVAPVARYAGELERRAA